MYSSLPSEPFVATKTKQKCSEGKGEGPLYTPLQAPGKLSTSPPPFQAETWNAKSKDAAGNPETET